MKKMSFYLSANFLLIFISITHAVYNGNCTRNEDCSRSNDMRCDSHRCVCNAPWFTPCNSSFCIAEKNINYVGDSCRTNENCLANAKCNAANQKCECEEGFTHINGLCYKGLNSTCQSHHQCWSRVCHEGTCQCPVGHIPHEDNIRCKVRLIHTYTNWTLANAYGDFCYDNPSCYDQIATCRNDSVHAEKFCQCPPTHMLNLENKICEWHMYNGLSPSSRPLPNTACGKCKVSNAICAQVNEQTTCWCRAGFVKENDQNCKKQQQKYIFPSHSNIITYKYNLTCSSYKSNGLCQCHPGYEYSTENSTCQPIVPKWIDDQLEYGVCTRINSHEEAIRVDDLCPAPLTCEARKDKYVCSCGKDKYLDIENSTCYSYLNRNVTNANCPANSKLIDSQCRCHPSDIYLPVNNAKCELKLTNENLTNCNASETNHAECIKRFGEYAKFCKQGQCRCLANSSFYQGNKCVTLIGISATSNSSCPMNAEIFDGKCRCKAGHRANPENQICGRLNVSLSNSTNLLPVNLSLPLTDADCQALDFGQYVQYNNDSCICKENSIALNNFCTFQLNYTFPNITLKCPEFAIIDNDTCQCQLGYEQIDDYTCKPIAQRVHEHNQGNENITGLTDEICKKLFGNATEMHSTPSYCQCRNSSSAFFSQSRCYFLIDVIQTEPFGSSDCPPNSIANDRMCTCPKFYTKTADGKGCNKTVTLSFARKTMDSMGAVCSVPYTSADCESDYGTGAICNQTECFCDQSKAYVSKDRCKLYSDTIFPGEHEWHSYVCETNADCGSSGTECGFLNNDFKVCICQENYHYNPDEKKCVENCGKCAANEKCQGYECVCVNGYYRDSSNKCVEINKRFNLYDQCNQTYFSRVQTKNEEYQCSSDCEHIRCQQGYRNDGTTCVKHQLNDRCAHDVDLCARVIPDAKCDVNENKCICPVSSYLADDGNSCVKTVGTPCAQDIECGKVGLCTGGQCQCKQNAEVKDDVDRVGRPIKRCVEVSSVDQLKSYPIVILILSILATHLLSA